MAHHLLTIYGTGGNSEALQNAFDMDSSFQAATVKPHAEVFKELQSGWTSAHEYLGNVNYSPDFLMFFQGEMEKKGWQQVVEKAAAADPSKMSLTLPELLEQVHSDENFVNSFRHEDPNAIRVKIDPEDVEERVAENIHTAAYMASASVFHPPHVPPYDSFLIHHLTLAPILVLLGQATWIPQKVKHRILEWKGRFDILQYVARWCPPLQIESVAKYKPYDASLADSKKELLP
ncbi:hypothetical protein S40288_09380 [Stachybotrys chartarum IBT 40288]|nr:hypothetical protein S40288_09380 [Stachybotrys chartarum IBT 40288]